LKILGLDAVRDKRVNFPKHLQQMTQTVLESLNVIKQNDYISGSIGNSSSISRTIVAAIAEVAVVAVQ